MRIYVTAVALALCTACTIVAGRIRPAWSPSWSEVSCADAVAGDGATLAVLVKDAQGNTLPGVTVSAAAESRGTSSREQVTDRYGETQLKLSAGVWHIRAELAAFGSAERRMSLVASDRCHLLMYLQLTPSVITVAAVSPNSPLHRTRTGALLYRQIDIFRVAGSRR